MWTSHSTSWVSLQAGIAHNAGAAPQRQEAAADDLGQQHLAHFAALANDIQLHSLVAGQHIGPGQGDELGDPQAYGVGDL